MPPVRFLPAAKTELLEAAFYYEQQAPGLGSRFAAEVRQALTDIRQHPDAWPQCPDGTRRRLLGRFPYLIVYLQQPDGIWIVAVAHAKRRRGYWSGRTGGVGD